MAKIGLGAATVGMLLVLSAPAPALAQAHAGVRAGVAGDPGQFAFGGHIETRPIIEHVTFRPNVEVGVGDSLTTVAVNIEFAYWWHLQHRHPWSVYAGGGPAAVVTSAGSTANRHSHVGPGFNFLIGLQHREGLFTELKIGAMDSPGLRFTVGYAFR